jgi:hypothetical protein
MAGGGRKARKAAKGGGFSAEERAAMRERARELKAEARAKGDRAAGERAVLAALAALPGSDRALGERLHALVTEEAPGLVPRLWYGMPAWANGDGKVVCFFQAAKKFGTRYAAFAFADAARLDEGGMWPTAFAVMELSAADEGRLRALVRRAAG